MTEFNYLKEKARMLKSFGYKDHCTWDMCAQCPLSGLSRERKGIPCARLEIDYPEEAEAEVRVWACAHPIKTRKDVLLEHFPNAVINKNGVPDACAYNLGMVNYEYYAKCDCEKCVKCWNMEVGDE